MKTYRAEVSNWQKHFGMVFVVSIEAESLSEATQNLKSAGYNVWSVEAVA